MTILYVVTAGSYSDYGIWGIYSTKELAEEAQKVFVETNDIEEWELDKICDNYRPGKLVYRVNMDKEGNGKAVQDSPYFNIGLLRMYSDKRSFYTTVWATDEKHAIKIANEKRIQILALNLWDTDYNVWPQEVREWKEE